MKLLRYFLLFQIFLGLGLLVSAYSATKDPGLPGEALMAPDTTCDPSECPQGELDAGVALAPQSGGGPVRDVLAVAPSDEVEVVSDQRDAGESGAERANTASEVAEGQLEQAQSRSGDDKQAGVIGTNWAPNAGLEGQYETLWSEEVADRQELHAQMRVEAELRAFVQSVFTGNAGVVTGVFVPGALALPVRHQPASNPGYISSEDYTVTQFDMAQKYGSVGLLAHNHLSGSQFFDLCQDQPVYLVYGDGKMRKFVVSEIHRYKADSPNSPYSNFEDLENDGERLSARELFHLMYDRDNTVVFQTCIEGEGISTWGRLFIIATPV